MDLFTVQNWIRASLSADLSAFAATRNWTALAAVLPLGILFGAVHALTPGHGKAVLASYLLGSRLAVLRGVAVAFVLALTHVGSAVVLALVANALVTRTLGGVGRAPLLENISRGLLGLIGVWLVWRACRAQQPTHDHSTAQGWTVGIVAGLIPCPLTLFIMVTATARGVPEAGLTFAIAMMIGVGLTLSLVAILTLFGRDWMLAIFERHGHKVARISRVLDALAGGLLVVIAGRELLR